MNRKVFNNNCNPYSIIKDTEACKASHLLNDKVHKIEIAKLQVDLL